MLRGICTVVLRLLSVGLSIINLTIVDVIVRLLLSV